MLFDKEEFGDIIKEASGNVVKEVAPDEFETFDEIYAQVSGQAPRADEDSKLGFGVDAFAFLSSPAAIGMVTSVAGFLFAELVKSLKDESTVIIKDKVKKMFKKGKDDSKTALPQFTKEQFAQLRQLAVDSAKKNGASDEISDRMANCLIASMNLPQ